MNLPAGTRVEIKLGVLHHAEGTMLLTTYLPDGNYLVFEDLGRKLVMVAVPGGTVVVTRKRSEENL